VSTTSIALAQVKSSCRDGAETPADARLERMVAAFAPYRCN